MTPLHSRFSRLTLTLTLAAGAVCGPSPLQAQGTPPAGDVVLRLKGGGFEIGGTLRAFDGARYVIDSRQNGRMTLNAARYECIGETCTSAPSAASLGFERLYAERAETVAIKGPDGPATILLPALLRGYAESGGMELVPVLGSKSAPHELRLLDDKGERLASLELAPTGTAPGIEAVRDGIAAIALADRRATAAETQALTGARTRLPGARSEYALGQDGLAVIVAPTNPVPALALDTIARILVGEIGDWYELGLPPGRITVHLRDDASSQPARIAELLLTPRRLALGAAITRHATDAALADTVARDAQGFGLVSLAAVRSARTVNLETSCGLQLRPTAFGVKSGEYPLSLPLYLYAAAPPKEAAARGLLRFLDTGAAASVIDQAGFMSQAPSAVGLDQQAERLAHATNAQGEAFELSEMRALLVDLKGWKRLSITFRLPPGSTTADARTRAEAERLVAFMQAPENKTRRIFLTGFTDVDGGKFQANLSHSYKRASLLRQIVAGVGGPSLDSRRITTKGYGPLAPIACNDSADGRTLNRRVEVWASGE